MRTPPTHSRTADNVLAFTDGAVVYCPRCVRRLRLLEEGVTPPNWLPFISIDIVDDLPQKDCCRCGLFLEDGSGGAPWD